MQRETRFKLKVMKELDKLKPLVWYTKIQQVVKRGDPDLLLCVFGNFVAWELKVGGNKATPLQEHTLASIRRANGRARVVTPENFETELGDIKLMLPEEEP